MNWLIVLRLLGFLVALAVVAYLAAVAEGSPLAGGRDTATRNPKTWFLAPLSGLAKGLSDQRVARLPRARVLATVAPWIAPMAWAVTLALLPVVPGHAVVGMPAAAVAVVAAVTAAASGPLFLGLSSEHRIAHLAGIRAVQQLLAGWVPLVVALAVPLVAAGTLDLNTVAARWQWWWTAAFLPAFVVYLLACAIVVHRAPFGAPRAPELGAHYLGGRSSTDLAVHRFGELLGLGAVSAVGAMMFLGGWAGPLPVYLGWLWFALKAVGTLLLLVALRRVPGRIEIPEVTRLGGILPCAAGLTLAAVATGVWLL